MKEFIQPKPEISAEEIAEKLEKSRVLASSYLQAIEGLTEEEAGEKLGEMTEAEVSELAQKSQEELKKTP